MGFLQVSCKRGEYSTLWQGPYEVVATRNATTIGVRMIGSKDEPTFVHWSLVKRFCGKHVAIPVEVVEQAQRAAAQFEVEEFRGLTINDKGRVEVLVSWVGFPATYDTWEDAEEIYKDVGSMFKKYLAKHKQEHEVFNALYDSLQKPKKKKKKK